ncbi:putative O-methyltransferase YrrM [Pontibacter aydingkolensis]|uniref:Class I SAM-dependent methyltransferase n=1 Tax=Pontibacter aydingkolensis TaxID=1911536 RepID=A0ABS7CPK7_9BACT|nr:class I SAM-dependent methyltransferase [Pontibacter aydingkolensis]MBW7465770.1 class I SAM-dependent methyltransferase [Pontibacter aydingkolensis]
MRLFTPEEKQFIQEHQHHDPAALMLQAKRFPHLPVLELVQQIQARQKAANKLPTWTKNPDVVFPVTLSVEQSSSETTAAFKAFVVKGYALIDLTGGFGVDSLYFAKCFKQVMHLEQNKELQQIAAHNFKLLGADNIQSIHTTAEDFLNAYTGHADVIYLDPARRGNREEKLHLLQDCEPDVLHLLPLLLQKAKTVLLKTSPMLDIDQALEELRYVSKVWVVAVQNEVKEVLYLLQPDAPVPTEVPLTAVNILQQEATQSITFTRTAEEAATPHYTDPQQFVYEPNAAILKAGAFRFLGQQYNLSKLHPNSHLYTSATLVPDFPGRSFRCIAVSRYNKKELLRYLPAKKANITVRNFPEPVAEIRRKTGIKEGGDIYLFFTTDMHQKPVALVCQKA